MGDWCCVTALSLAFAVPCWIAQSFTALSFLDSDEAGNNLTLVQYNQWKLFQPAITANAWYMLFRPFAFAFSCYSKIMLLNKIWHLFLPNRSKVCVLSASRLHINLFAHRA